MFTRPKRDRPAPDCTRHGLHGTEVRLPGKPPGERLRNGQQASRTTDSGSTSVTQPLEGRGSQRAGAGPLAELDARHQRRLDEDGALRRLPPLERALVGPEGLELAPEERQRRLGEAGAHLAGVAERALVVVDTHGERAQGRGAAAAAGRVAADHDVLDTVVLDLDPGAWSGGPARRPSRAASPRCPRVPAPRWPRAGRRRHPRGGRACASSGRSGPAPSAAGGGRDRAAPASSGPRATAGRRSRTSPGSRFIRRRTAESEARCMRDCSRSKLGRPSGSKATTSPSRIIRRDPCSPRPGRASPDSAA